MKTRLVALFVGLELPTNKMRWFWLLPLLVAWTILEALTFGDGVLLFGLVDASGLAKLAQRSLEGAIFAWAMFAFIAAASIVAVFNVFPRTYVRVHLQE